MEIRIDSDNGNQIAIDIEKHKCVKNSTIQIVIVRDTECDDWITINLDELKEAIKLLEKHG